MMTIRRNIEDWKRNYKMDLQYMFKEYCETLHNSRILDMTFSHTQSNYNKFCLLVYNKSSKCII